MTPTDKELVERLEKIKNILLESRYITEEGGAIVALTAAIQRLSEQAKELEAANKKFSEVAGIWKHDKAELEAAREAEREQCAKWHEEEAASLRKGESNYAWQTESTGENPYTRKIAWHMQCAAAIRALKEQGNGE